MDALATIAMLILFAIAAARWGVESRPGFVDGRIDRKERWFIHSRND